MQLLGVTSLDELEPRHVTQLQRLAPVPRSVRPIERRYDAATRNWVAASSR